MRDRRQTDLSSSGHYKTKILATLSMSARHFWGKAEVLRGRPATWLNCYIIKKKNL